MKEPKILFLGTYPHSDNPIKGIFNKNAVNQISQITPIDVVSIRMWKPGRRLMDKVEEGEITVYHLNIPHYPSTNLFIHPLSTLVVNFFLWLLLKSIIPNYKIVHSVGAATYGVYGSYLMKKFDLKHVIQLVGSDINADLPRLFRWRYIKNITHSIHVLTGNSMALVRSFNTLFNVKFPMLAIYRGVNLNKFNFRDNQFYPPKGVRFLFLGGLNRYPNLPAKMNTKGGLTLMKAWSEAEANLKERKASLVFGGPQSDREEFFVWRNTLQYPELVELVGELSPAEVIKAYHTTNVVIIPSMEEGLPNVATEAAACGRPVIASSVGGIPEVVDDKTTGLLLAPGNSSELSQAMLTMAANQEMVKQMGVNARLKMEESFNASKFAPAYQKIYNQLLS